MGHLPDSFQDRSAAHYLLDEMSGARLRTTLALAARSVGFPIAMINILDSDTQHTISSVGMATPIPQPRSSTFCDVVVRDGRPLVVEDTELAQFAGIPAPSRAAVGTYIGVPLVGRESLIVGSLCVLDHQERPTSPELVDTLVSFGHIVDDQLDLIRRLNEERGRVRGNADELARALEDGRIVPWYQPVIELATGRTVGVEALARWVDSVGRVRQPWEFIPLGEDSDLIVELDRAILRRSIEDISRWQHVLPSARLMVNMSGRNFQQDGWIGEMHSYADRFGVDTATVSVELTETARLAAGSESADVAQQLRTASGCCSMTSAPAGRHWSTCCACRPPASRSTGCCRRRWAPRGATR